MLENLMLISGFVYVAALHVLLYRKWRLSILRGYRLEEAQDRLLAAARLLQIERRSARKCGLRRHSLR